MLFNIFLILLFLVLSASFSSAETAFFSLSKIQLKKLENDAEPSSRRISRLLKRPRDLLITILLCNTVVNIAASALSAIILINAVGKERVTPLMLLPLMLGMTILLIIFGEIAPKLFALSKAEKWSKISSLYIEMLYYLLYPLIKILVFISHLFSPHNDAFYKDYFTTEDIKNIVGSKSKNHPLDENEKKIINGIFNFSIVDAKKVMIPRVDIEAISVLEGIDNLKKKIVSSGHSRLPVYKKNIDEIIGIVYAKDIVLNPNPKSIVSILRKPIYVTEKTKINHLLNLFQVRKTHMAIVVDEYGGTSGIITLEDILEELVGDIIDEYDNEKPAWVKLNNNEYLASGMLDIDELNSILDLDIDTSRYDNLAGFLYDVFNHVPEEGEQLRFNDKAVFTIQEIKGQRIETVNVLKIHESEA